VEEDAGDKKRPREQDGRDAQRVTDPVYRVLMTGSVLRDPFFVGSMLVSAMLVAAMFVAASAQHAEDDITIRGRRWGRDLAP